MAIKSDAELAAAVEKAGGLLQEIQDYVKRDFTRPTKVRFPRGYIRPASEARTRLDFSSFDIIPLLNSGSPLLCVCQTHRRSDLTSKLNEKVDSQTSLALPL